MTTKSKTNDQMLEAMRDVVSAQRESAAEGDELRYYILGGFDEEQLELVDRFILSFKGSK